ncbi:amidohydrolase family protein [Granulosicoccus sp. 3-233]|uniref:amidohydrolase family protein n=1 Tax=Granulosicoccus sp. 3-233 TaxID=3417969 RepID=UPI003D34AC0B
MSDANRRWAFDDENPVCDTHVHVFDTRNHAMADTRSYTPGMATVSMLRSMHHANGIGRTVLVQPSVYGSDNSCLLESLARVGIEKARGIAVIDPQHADSKLLLRMHQSGVRGLRANFKTGHTAEVASARDYLQALDELPGELPWILQSFSRSEQLLELADCIAACKRPFVLDHFAGLKFDGDDIGRQVDGIVDLLNQPNVYLKLSAPHRALNYGGFDTRMPLFVERCLSVAPDRIIWGSDWPHTGPSAARAGRTLEQVEPFMCIDEHRELLQLSSWCGGELLQAVLVRTPERLFGFDDPGVMSAGF